MLRANIHNKNYHIIIENKTKSDQYKMYSKSSSKCDTSPDMRWNIFLRLKFNEHSKFMMSHPMKNLVRWCTWWMTDNQLLHINHFLVIRQKSAKLCSFWCSSRSPIRTQACSIEICPILAGAHYPAHSLSLSFDGAAKVTADFYSERHKWTWVPNYIPVLQTKLQNNNNKITVYMLQDNLIFSIYIRVERTANWEVQELHTMMIIGLMHQQ
jgi:hypothetical protein